MPQRSVRHYTEVGSSLSLSCNYQLEGSTLYSIKWYRDDMEFFRFTPSGISGLCQFFSIVVSCRILSINLVVHPVDLKGYYGEAE
jgi:hypothetical protein